MRRCVGVKVKGTVDIGDHGWVVVVEDVGLKGGELCLELGRGSDWGLLLGIVTVGLGDDVVKGLEVGLNVGEVRGDEVDLTNERAHGRDIGGKGLVDNGVQVGGRVGDKAVGNRVAEEGGGGGGELAFGGGEVDIVVLAEGEHSFEVLEVRVKVG